VSVSDKLASMTLYITLIAKGYFTVIHCVSKKRHWCSTV